MSDTDRIFLSLLFAVVMAIFILQLSVIYRQGQIWKEVIKLGMGLAVLSWVKAIDPPATTKAQEELTEAFMAARIGKAELRAGDKIVHNGGVYYYDGKQWFRGVW